MTRGTTDLEKQLVLIADTLIAGEVVDDFWARAAAVIYSAVEELEKQRKIEKPLTEKWRFGVN